jgi:chorismate mutase
MNAVPATTDTATSSTADAAPAPDEVIASNRARIDELDARIIELVKERMAASRAVQQARMGAGGRRVHLAREMEILRTYGDALGGRPGTSVAMTLLELCRGTV